MENDLHPVIKSLLNRRGLKVPVDDDRKISLVLFGGIMAGVAGGAAMIALEELGLSNAFDNIFVVSAGLPNASYLLSEQTKLGTSIYYDNLNGLKFLNYFTFWKGAQIEKVINAIHYLKPLNVEKVLKSNTKIHVRLLNVRTGEAEYLILNESCKNDDDYFDILRAAIALPLFHPIKINKYEYEDGSLKDKEYKMNHLNYATSHEYTDMLIIYNQKENYLGVGYNKICEIILPWEHSKYETNRDILIDECRKAGDCIKQVFGFNEPISLL